MKNKAMKRRMRQASAVKLARLSGRGKRLKKLGTMEIEFPRAPSTPRVFECGCKPLLPRRTCSVHGPSLSPDPNAPDPEHEEKLAALLAQATKTNRKYDHEGWAEVAFLRAVLGVLRDSETESTPQPKTWVHSQSRCPGCAAWVNDRDGVGVLSHVKPWYPDGCGYAKEPQR